MPPEERNNPSRQIGAFANDVAIQVFAVVVVPAIRNDLPNLEERSELVQAVDALCALRDNELVSHLVAGPVAASAATALLADETDREASFSVYKTNNPAKQDQPFLLIFRTGQIVTAHRASLGRVPAGYTGFSSI